MSENLCKLINSIDKSITVNVNNSLAFIEFDNILTEYCTEEEGGGKKECFSYEVLISSIFIKLLKIFMNLDDLENDKHAQYAILWFCHKLNKNSQNGINNLNDVYNKYIKGNKEFFEKINDAGAYNSYEEFINKKQDMVNVNIKDMSKFYEALQILCKMYTKIDESKSNCTKCLDDAQKFADEYEKINSNSITGNDSYSQMLSNLFVDYDNLKNKCKNSSSLPTIKKPQNFEQRFEVTSSNSSIATKLIPTLLIFAMSFFFGIAYKYSLFGFGKRSQKQYLKKRLKK
ncbi:CIR protein [Plasmodium chabaudi chabaudi]|uniref:CIR protein n=1 Tax=Plasmodium chabaudi chabaudi TaxID=31271 RepID=A0A4V0KA60_PLACU|nr:CIR protein [Plasmodium chabaudi chabaudi]VTZ69958.1 CIR protein [Plasmodium chabaudi chabaudi]|eukprot:XP_016652900.1 CIR protein [Plasmodium chabaudi chabaudi]